MTTFTLEPQENDRLQSLCGAFDENIKLIEKEFNLDISRNNFTFTVKVKLLREILKLNSFSISLIFSSNAPQSDCRRSFS